MIEKKTHVLTFRFVYVHSTFSVNRGIFRRVNKKCFKFATQILVAILQNYLNQSFKNTLIGMVSAAYPWSPREPGPLDTPREGLQCP